MRSMYADSILGKSLICEFLFNEGAGGYIRDGSPAKLIGTLVTPDWVIEPIGYNLAPTLDFVLANTDYVNLGTDAVWDDINTTQEVTFEVLMHCDAALGTVQTVFSSMVDGTAGVTAFPQLLVDTNGYLLFRPCVDDAGTGKEVSTSTDDYSGIWAHVVCSYSSGQAEIQVVSELYGDSIISYTETITGTTTLSTLGDDNFYLGVRQNFDAGPAFENYFDGHIALFRAWSRRLSQSERKRLYYRIASKVGL